MHEAAELDAVAEMAYRMEHGAEDEIVDEDDEEVDMDGDEGDDDGEEEEEEDEDDMEGDEGIYLLLFRARLRQ
jgi:hypothetical protein